VDLLHGEILLGFIVSACSNIEHTPSVAVLQDPCDVVDIDAPFAVTILNLIAMPSAPPPLCRSRLGLYLTGGALIAALAVFIRFAHPFLTVDSPVPADALVIEGWLPDYAMAGTVAEIRRGNYQYLLVPGVTPSGDRPPNAVLIRDHLVAAGIAHDRIIVVIVPATRWNRTSNMARAVRDRLAELHVMPSGINIVTIEPHARQSLLAYSRILGPSIPTGVVSLPPEEYDPARWWTSFTGVRWTTKMFAGWLRELTFGLRS
jgi:hypothetical protein